MSLFHKWSTQALRNEVLWSHKRLGVCLQTLAPQPKKKNAFVLCSLKIIIIYLSELEEIKYIHSNFLQTLLPLYHFCICVTWFQIKRVSFFLWKDHSNSITQKLDRSHISFLIKPNKEYPGHFQSFRRY